MDLATISNELKRHHKAFVDTVRALPAQQLELSPNGKWSPGQHVEHLRMSVHPVALAMLLPRWFLRYRFGTPNRAPRSYEALVQRYKEKLAAGGQAPSTFVPRTIRGADVAQHSTVLEQAVYRLSKRSLRWNEADLDRYLLPHPLLGKLTLREMLYFTIYHAQHHKALVERDHGNSNLR